MTGISTINMKPSEGNETINRGNTEAQPKSSSNKHGRMFLVVAPIIFTLIATAGIALVAVYFGTRQTFKEGKVTVYTADMPPIEEIITVREAEVEVNAPGRFTVLSDYRKFISVFKVHGMGRPRCYVSNLNRTVVGTPEEMERNILAKERIVSPDAVPVKYISTGVKVDPTTLSEHAKIMCDGAQVEWIAQLKDGVVFRRKRCHGGDETTVIIEITILIVVEQCEPH